MRLLRKSFFERDPFRLGLTGSIIGLLLMVCVIKIGDLPFFHDGRNLKATFSEAGGLNTGDDVEVAGLKVGVVDAVELAGDRVQVTFRVTDQDVSLGHDTSARIATTNLLGKKVLELAPRGAGELPNGATITNTTAPYDITQALEGLTGRLQDLDVAKVSEALDALSSTIEGASPQLKGALTSLDTVATTIGARDAELSRLLHSTSVITETLSSRNEKISTLLDKGVLLLGTLEARRLVINSLLRNATAAAEQIRGLVREQHARFAPMLTKLSATVDLLERNKDVIAAALKGLAQYISELGEAVGGGPEFAAYIPNMTDPTTLPIYPTIILDFLRGDS